MPASIAETDDPQTRDFPAGFLATASDVARGGYDLAMGRIVYWMQQSLDGYVAGPGGDLDWNVVDDAQHAWFNDRVREASALLHGRGMWETMAGYWPTADQDPDLPPVMHEFARIWCEKPKIVFSRTLDHVGHGAVLDRGDDLAGTVGRLRAEHPGDLILGGAGLAASMFALDLVDRIDSYIAPVLIGAGKRMFGPLEQHLRLRLVETRTWPNGLVLLRYERAR